ncbi:RHS repeat-associated core domain-containing protein [Pseudomonas moorei]|uniref:RHS repeat-associated core domain-containing protein n=1 Tax=Pseudomonas moorei TaxID=395599 RepID=UPI001FF12924|nr:RHS repeat-associated core domain-containing protein [Pseudomonas moorei]
MGFNGQLREARLGWYLLGNGYRAYNTRLMRFHSPDSWSPFGGGGLNAYMYCVGDPVNRVDPTGHMWDAIKLFVRENIRYRTPQTLAIANARASERQRALSILSRSSRSVEPSNPSRQSDAVSAIGGYIMGAPGARNSTPSPGGDLAPQNIKGWERPLPGQGTSWTVSPTARQSHSSKGISTGRATNPGSPSNTDRTTMPLWNSNTKAAALSHPNVTTAYPVGVGSPSPSGAVQHGSTASSSVRPPTSAAVGSSTHSSINRPTAVVAAIRRNAPATQRSPSPSPPTSRDSTPPRSRNPSGSPPHWGRDDGTLTWETRRR